MHYFLTRNFRAILLPLLTMFLIFNSITLEKIKAQTFADRNKKEILNILPKEDKKFTYSVGGTAANILWVAKKFNTNPYVLEGDLANYNAATTSAKKDSFTTTKDENLVFFGASIKNVNDKYLDFFTAYNQPTVELSGSFAINSVKWVNWNNLRLFNGKFFKQWDSYVKLYANNGFSNYFDTTGKKFYSAKEMPFFNWGMQTDFIGYNKRYWIVFIGNFFHGMPTDNLDSYQDKLIPAINMTNPTIVPTGKSAGKFGSVLNKNQWNARGSFALPVFLGDLASGGNNFVSKLVLIPNYSAFGGLNKKWNQLFGASLGIIKKSYNSSNNDAIIIKPMLQLGLDWQTDRKTKNGISTPGWIIAFKGTF